MSRWSFLFLLPIVLMFMPSELHNEQDKKDVDISGVWKISGGPDDGAEV